MSLLAGFTLEEQSRLVENLRKLLGGGANVADFGRWLSFIGLNKTQVESVLELTDDPDRDQLRELLTLLEEGCN